MPLKRAVKQGIRLRMSLAGPPGSGKTFTSLRIATALVQHYGGRIAVIDTEHGSASRYADLFDFDVIELADFHPQQYINALKEIHQAGGYTVVIIDSLSHAWMGKGGVLEIVDNAGHGNSYAGWKQGTPWQNNLVNTLLAAPFHIIATMRSKMGYVQEDDPARPGKTRIRKVGMQAQQREGVEYEFDIAVEVDPDLGFTVAKTRCPALTGQVYRMAGEDVAQVLTTWLDSGGALVEMPAPAIAAPVAAVHASTPAADVPMATPAQRTSIGKLYQTLGLGDVPEVLTYDAARQMLVQLSDQARKRNQPQPAPQRTAPESPDADEEWSGPETQEAWDAEAEQEEPAAVPAAAPPASTLPPFPNTAIPAAEEGGKPINAAQIKTITMKCSQRGLALPVNLNKLTDGQARAVINYLQKAAA